MWCPHCGHEESRVIDSRDSGEGIRRRRECGSCGERFSTLERLHLGALVVVKQDGRREQFSREKLLYGIRLACAKRPLPTGTIEKVADEIEARLDGMGRAEVASHRIGEAVMERLRGIDRVAYIRFASVYRAFADAESFREEVDALAHPPEQREQYPQLQLIPWPEQAGPQRRRQRSRRQGQAGSQRAPDDGGQNTRSR